MAKSRNLKNIEINEISLVDLPANKLPFLFFKRKGDNDPINKQKKVTIGIESDGTVGGTKITVNGKKLGKLRSFDFSFYGADPKATIHASYSKETGDKDGFTRTETFYLSKGEQMKSETLKAIQAYLDTEEIDFEKKVSEEDIAKALTLITEHYKESFPEDLEKAVGVIAKCAVKPIPCPTCGEDGEGDLKKAGAKFSKDVLKKLKAVLAAVEALKGILPEMKEGTEKSDGGDAATSELAKQLAELKEALAKMDTEKKDTGKSDLAELTKTLRDISKRVKDMEESGVARKSISGDDDTNDDEPKGAGEKGEQLWPTITGQTA